MIKLHSKTLCNTSSQFPPWAQGRILKGKVVCVQVDAEMLHIFPVAIWGTNKKKNSHVAQKAVSP